MQLSKTKMWMLTFLLMSWHLWWRASSPWGAHLLFCVTKSSCSWWKAGKIPLGQLWRPRFAYRKAYFRAFEKRLISSWWLSRTALLVKIYRCPLPGAQGGSSCMSLSFFAYQRFPLVLASSRLSQSPQAASRSHYCSVCQAGSARSAECSVF